MTKLLGDMSNEQMVGAASAGWDILKQVADERLPAASIAAGDKLLQSIEKLHSFKSLRTCLVHGDYRFPNILYRDGNEAITVDWQTYQWSTPGIDLAHGVLCSLDINQAHDFYEECLNHYHQKMVEASSHWGAYLMVGMVYPAQAITGLLIVLLLLGATIKRRLRSRN